MKWIIFVDKTYQQDLNELFIWKDISMYREYNFLVARN